MVVAVASGKGGTGKTFLSTNLFETLLDSGVAARLVDCDVEVPNSKLFFGEAIPVASSQVRVFQPVIDAEKCMFCGECAKHCVYNAILCVPARKKIKVMEAMCHSCRACETVCRSGAVQPSEVVVGTVGTFEYRGSCSIVEGRMTVSSASGGPVIKEAIRIGKELSRKGACEGAQAADEMIVLDAPPGTSCPFMQTALRADLVILVTEPTPFGLSDLNQAMGTLEELKVPYVVVVNKCDIGFDYRKKIRPGVNIIAEIPFSRDFAAGYAQGRKVEQLPQAKVYFEKIRDFILEWQRSLSAEKGGMHETGGH